MALPEPGGTLARIHARMPSLNSSEQRVAGQFLSNPLDIALLSVSQVAELTGTSSATVTRTCQKLGLKGFPQTRMLLLRDGFLATEREKQTLDSSQNWVPLFFERIAQDLSSAHGAFDIKVFDRIVQALLKARRVLIVANGASSVVALNAAIEFQLAGLHPEAPTDAVIQQMAARTLTSDDVCFVISSTGRNNVTLPVVQAARSATATLVTLTGYSSSPIADLCDHVLVIGATPPHWESSITLGPIFQLVAIQALKATLQSKLGNGEHASHVLEQLMSVMQTSPPPVSEDNAPD